MWNKTNKIEMIEMKVQKANLCLEEYINPLLPLLHMSYDDVRVPDTANIKTAHTVPSCVALHHISIFLM